MPDGTGYDEDFVLWSYEQARQIRAMGEAGSNINLDWENVAEEIESLGRSDKRQLGSRLDTIYEHLLKLQFSPAIDPRNGWIDTIERERSEVKVLLTESPSLRRLVETWITHSAADVARRTARQLRRYGETAAASAVALVAGDSLARRVLDEDFIPHPPEPTTLTST